MSYILDALRRADAERTRGQVPDLHAQPAVALDDEPARPPGRLRAPLLVAGAALAVVVLAGLVGWWFAGSPAEPVAARPDPAPRPPAEVPAVAPPPPTVPPPQPAAVAAAALPAPAAVPSALPPAAPSRPAAGARPPTLTEAAAALRPAPRRTDRAGAPAAGASAAAAVVPLAELAPELRRALPALRFGGAIGSPNPASRVLIVDGALLHEGDEAAPGVTLREIRLRSAVVEFRGQRIELPY